MFKVTIPTHIIDNNDDDDDDVVEVDIVKSLPLHRAPAIHMHSDKSTYSTCGTIILEEVGACGI